MEKVEKDTYLNEEKSRCLSPSHDKQRYFHDGFVTETSIEQAEIEDSVKILHDWFRDIVELEPKAPVLRRADHLKYLRNGLHILPPSLQVLDASRPWLVYWIIHSLELLNDPIPEDTAKNIVNFLKNCQHPDGGFGGGPGQEAHLAPTYAAVCALCILRTEEAFDAINRESLLKFLMNIKKSDGSFCLHQDSESDIRGTYCALAVAKLTNIWCTPLIKNTAHWVSRCQTYEGGFGGVPYMEAHGGYTFCGLASLILLKEGHLVNINNLMRWLVNRQTSFEGGFQGRTNKLVDSCYSYWQGGSFPLLHRLLSKTDADCLSEESWLFDRRALQEYLLICCQAVRGGLLDKPGKRNDYYHTCYSLSGLSVAQHFHSGKSGNECMVGSYDNELMPIHPVYNICVPSAIKAIQYFQQLPFPNIPELFESENDNAVETQ